MRHEKENHSMGNHPHHLRRNGPDVVYSGNDVDLFLDILLPSLLLVVLTVVVYFIF